MQGELLKLQGVVEHVIFENPETGYAVFEVDAGGTDVVVSGNVGSVDNGMSVVVYGQMTNHPSYGEQFRAESCEAALPQDTAAILSYLSSGVLPYIGPSTAKKLVAKFGAETLTVIAEQPDRLCELKGLTPHKAAAISAEFRRLYGVREVIAWMARFGLSPQTAVTAYRAFGAHAVEALERNPYLLCGEPLNLKFSQVDGIARTLEVAAGSGLRLSAGLLYTLRHNAGNGHTCLPRQKLAAATARFLRVEPDAVERSLQELLDRGEMRARTFEQTEYIYLPDLLAAEEDIAARLGEISTFPTEPPATLDSDIRVLEMAQGFAYAPLQRQAIRTALSSRVMVLTGGPGTGKTTTVNAILSLYEAAYDRVALCAPTGRAAKRLSELTRHSASTIHRLLEVDYSTGMVRFIHNEKNLLPFDVIILDEMSMVDVKLFQALLAAARPHCRFVLVGDADQLPSVGPGRVFADILKSGVIPAVRLWEIFRQAGSSRIVSYAHAINQGEQPPLTANKGDFFFLRRATAERTAETIVELARDRLPGKMGIPPRDIQVLTPTRKGPAGTRELNKRLQSALNPPREGKNEKIFGEITFREGDRVMQIRNNYDMIWKRALPTGQVEHGAGIYNGDMGEILAVDAANETLTVDFDGRVATLGFDALVELEHAWAVTVHKSQGSEYRAVLLAVSDAAPRLMTRGVLYTAVTRARELLIAVGDEDAARRMIDNHVQSRRYSGLGIRLRTGE